MYNKNLTEDLRLRLSTEDMNFLRDLSAKRGSSVSESIRSIIGEYRRSLEFMSTFKDAIDLAKLGRGGAVHGDTKTDLDNLV